MMNSIERSGSNNTRSLLAALAPLEQYGLEATQRAMVGFGRFPIAGEANYSHDWWFPRFGPGWRLHEGTDIFGSFGAPVRAPVDGRVRVKNGGVGGMTVTVFQPDGTYWYLAHLSGFAPGLVDGAQVRTGDVVGFVGTSGNAAGGKPHVHIQIHPQGGEPIDPKPVLDTFISDAIALAPQLVEAYAQTHANRVRTPAAAPQLTLPAPDLSLLLSHKSTELWVASLSPVAGAHHLAQHEVRRMVETIDWSTRATVAARAKAAGPRDAFVVQLWLAPLVPAELAWVLQPGDPP